MKTLPANTGYNIYTWLHDHYFDQFTTDDVNRKFHVNLTDNELYRIYAGDFVFTMPEFSFYRRPISNLKPAKSANIIQIFHAVKSNFYKGVTQRLRTIKDEAQQQIFKRYNFDYITPSGVFEERNQDKIISRSHYIVVDFDHTDDPEKIKNVLINDPHIQPDLIFVSPRGRGLKALIYDMDHAPHEIFYGLVQDYFQKKYPELFTHFDRQNKNIARGCFLSYDPDVYVNEKILKLWQAQMN